VIFYRAELDVVFVVFHKKSKLTNQKRLPKSFHVVGDLMTRPRHLYSKARSISNTDPESRGSSGTGIEITWADAFQL
jgi:hypothetical protein